jgi:sugar fermentation stimulation protein A
MRFTQGLLGASLIRRYKRFLADVRLDTGERLTAHCPNTGAMLGCDVPGSRVWLSESDNPRRKYRHTLEIVETESGVVVGVHTGRTNGIAREAIEAGLLPELGVVGQIRPEVPVPEHGARMDFLLEGAAGEPDCYLEVKNVTAAVESGIALFPDAVSTRAVRHLETLIRLVEKGHRAAICFCVQRSDVHTVRPAVEIHPEYARRLRDAGLAGVRLLGFRCRVSDAAIVPSDRVRVEADVV